MNYNKQKGFTLIELLVVVAIIGILAAVGITAFNGFLGNAKTNTAKANHKGIVSFMQTTFTKCSIGQSTIKYDGTATGVACSSTLQAAHITPLITHLGQNGFKNPYNTSNNAAVADGGNPGTKGQVNISCTGNTCTVISYTHDDSTESPVSQYVSDQVSKE